MDLLTHTLTPMNLKRLQKQGRACRGEGVDAGPMWVQPVENRGVGHPKPQRGIKPPHPFFTPRVRLPHFGNVSTLNSFPTHIDRNTELIPLIKPVDTPSAYPLPATVPQKQGQERNPIRYLSATELIPLIKPVDRIGDYNAPFSPLEIGNITCPNSFPTFYGTLSPFVPVDRMGIIMPLLSP